MKTIEVVAAVIVHLADIMSEEVVRGLLVWKENNLDFGIPYFGRHVSDCLEN